MREPIRPTSLKNHVVLVGHGRVGSFISSALSEQSVPLFVIEDDEEGVAALRQEGIEALEGNAADPAVIQAANLPEARCLLVAIPDAFEGGQVVQQAHAINPSLPIIARAHSGKRSTISSAMARRSWSWASTRSPRPCSTTWRRSRCWWRSPAAKAHPCRPPHAGGKRGLDGLKLSRPIMPHYTPLITTIVAALTLAWAFAAVAHKVELPPLVGYLLAGIVIGPFTPGYVADQNLAGQLAEIGVILLMFGVGLHFSLEDLLSVKKIAIPGAIAQIACATLLGMGLAAWLGWGIGAGLVFGLALSVASTVVLLRAMQERRLIETERGRIAVGWLIVEDIAMVLALVLLPVVAGLLQGEGASLAEIALALGLTAAKIAAFVAVMLIVGKRAIPWILHAMAHTGSRELFRLSVLVIALGAAFGAAELFGVSFALGAFFAGMILSELKLSQQAATETLPLRDAFAVLFFVSVGMLFDPTILVREPLPVLATLLIILVGKSLAAYAIVRAFGYANATALTISASLAQIGEFSFILANLGVALMLLPEQGRDLILAGAIISILLNPFLFSALDELLARQEARAKGAEFEAEDAASEPIKPTDLKDHVVLVGHGRVGSVVSQALERARGQALHHRGRRGRGRRVEGPRYRRASRQRGRPACDRGGEFAGGALPAGRHSGCLRGRAGGTAGPRHQSQADHRRQGAFRSRDPAPQEARRESRDHGRARNCHGDGGACHRGCGDRSRGVRDDICQS